MLRPNIRGIPRRDLRFRFFGWHDINSGRMIQHRWPWRDSWILRLENEPNWVPVLSRSGSVFLATKEKEVNLDQIAAQPARMKSPRVLGALVLLLFVPGTILAVWLSGAPARPVSDPEKNFVSTKPVSCESILAGPEKHVESWLSGKEDSRLEILELQKQQIGGLQSRVIRVNCGSLSAILQLTLFLEEENWTLKKFARLKN